MRETIMSQIATVRDPVEQRKMIDKVAEEAGVEKDLSQAQGLKKQGVGRMLPSYIGTVLNMAGQVVNAYADIAVAEKTMFNIGSPQGMLLTTLQKQIFETQKKWQLLNLVGTGIGSAIGLSTGIPGAMLAGGYLGGQLAEPLTSALGKYSTINTREKETLYSQFFPQLEQARGAFEKYQGSEYYLGRYSPYNPNSTLRKPLDYFKMDMTSLGMPNFNLGLSNADEMAMMTNYFRTRGGAQGGEQAGLGYWGTRKYEAMQQMIPGTMLPLANLRKLLGQDMNIDTFAAFAARSGMGRGREEEALNALLANYGQSSRMFMTPGGMTGATYMLGLPGMLFGTGTEAGKLGQQGQSNIANISQMATPQSDAHRALMYMAIAGGSGRNQSFMDINLRMRQGAMNRNNILDIIRILPKNRELAKAYLAAMMPEAGPDLINAMADRQAAGTLYSGVQSIPTTGAGESYTAESLTKGLANAAARVPSSMRQRAGLETKRADMFTDIQQNMYDIESQSLDVIKGIMGSTNVMKTILTDLNAAMSNMRGTMDNIQREISNTNPPIDRSSPKPGSHMSKADILRYTP
jgi:hypothetical protein